MQPLINHKKNVTSYDGEDGIIEEIFKRIGTKNKWCMEFGARDGKAASNTYSLISSGWTGILVEPNRFEFSQIKSNFERTARFYAENNFVDIEGKNSLDSILGRNGAPVDIDFINIDIDSFDYQVFESLEIYKPRLVCIEYNSSIDLDKEFVQPLDGPILGSSLFSVKQLASKKGYTLVYAQENNAFLIRNEIVNETRFAIFDEDFQKKPENSLMGTFILSHNNAIYLIPNSENYKRFETGLRNTTDPNYVYLYNPIERKVIVPKSFYSQVIINHIKSIVRDSVLGNIIYPIYRKYKNRI